MNKEYYLLIIEDTRSALVTEINNASAEGYVVHGPTDYDRKNGTEFFIQAMVLDCERINVFNIDGSVAKFFNIPSSRTIQDKHL